MFEKLVLGWIWGNHVYQYFPMVKIIFAKGTWPNPPQNTPLLLNYNAV